jgi:hypothetical protein
MAQQEIHNAFAFSETNFVFIGSYSTEQLAQAALEALGLDMDDEDDYEIVVTYLDDRVIYPLTELGYYEEE